VRLFNLALFAVSIIAFALKRPRFDVIMASTAPPVFVAAAGRLAARITGARFVYHCMDVHPEIGRISGEFSNSYLFKLLRWIDTGNCLYASRVVVLSGDMERAVRGRPGAEKTRIAVINNFDIGTSENEDVGLVPTVFAKRDGCLRVLFAGNIGRFQGLEAAVDAMSMLGDRDDVELIFMGEGRAADHLRARAGSLVDWRIRFFPHQPMNIAAKLIETADICLVSLRPEIYKYAYPSKTMTYLCRGRPLLVCVESASEIAEFVRAEEIGVVVEPNDAVGLRDAISDIARNREKLCLMAKRAATVGCDVFAESVVVERWSRLLKEIADEG
jgi:glycosyltransferase involved in cell wall biosynthesis